MKVTQAEEEDSSDVGVREEDGGSLFESTEPSSASDNSMMDPSANGQPRRVSAVQTDYCGGFKRSPVCAIV